MNHHQTPLRSGFGPTTTAREVLAGRDLSGLFVLVTGGHAGIGLETTRALSEAGATVLTGARSPEAARAALAGLPRVEVERLDLADPASIDAFAARFLERGHALQALILNAGIMACPLRRDGRGFEAQLATNHVGHFQLTARLWPALVRAGGARVVALSSRGHHRSPFEFEDPHYQRREYEKWGAYGQSKTANILFAVGLDRRGRDHGVRAYAVHPGAIPTDLMRWIPRDEARTLLETVSAHTRLKTAPQGAATSVWCATSPRLDGIGGVYCEDVDVAAPVDEQAQRGVRRYAIDPGAAERLWAISEAWTGAGLRA